ncbi:HYC_CC_PP family protein [Aquimarina sediminis]|uniref:HYC_CC_PP family protein n=1 Tax=Aquimarina sediminis TaxID=2070536 RepID=UPI001F4EE6B8|nr:hypothetical protein [Aquimarina sediminis]
MKKGIHKICAILMTLVVMFSTMSFTLDLHYCGRTLVDVALFKEAKTCGMELQATDSTFCPITKKGCCTDKQFAFEGQDELQHTLFDKITFEQQVFVASFYYSYIDLFTNVDNSVISFKEYPPPLLIKDIYVLYETFLI